MFISGLQFSFLIFLRYFLLSFFIDRFFKALNVPKIFEFRRSSKQRKREVILSIYSSLIFGVAFAILFKLWRDGIITTPASPSFFGQSLWLGAALLIHETYYYWLHRAMHNKKLYKYFHKGHHDSVEVSAWTSFSFDPLETLMQVIPFYFIVFILPITMNTFIAFLVVMSLSSVINHLNREVYPRFFRKVFPFNMIIGATHHALHHKEFNTNFGLYFTFWDKWMGTESKNYK